MFSTIVRSKSYTLDPAVPQLLGPIRNVFCLSASIKLCLVVGEGVPRQNSRSGWLEQYSGLSLSTVATAPPAVVPTPAELLGTSCFGKDRYWC